MHNLQNTSVCNDKESVTLQTQAIPPSTDPLSIKNIRESLVGEGKTPVAAAPSIEILKDAPATIAKPLALVNGTAYAATWLHFKRTITQSLQNGKAITLSSPIVKTERGLYLIREDGMVFGDGKTPMKDLPVSVALAEIPPSHKLWTAGGVEAYQNGYRPNAADVFMRLTDIVDRFIDFNKSLAPQRTMSEMIACYALGTWFLDGFNVIGFIWPNGDRGCGKTQLITLTAELSYLGMVVLSGGSFASLRDMADYGATLAFDDAEGLSDPKKTDLDKRALLLAGNRRGNTVPVKEPGPNRTWRTRYVNTFCPRLFSATRLPDPILASRTIIVPLIRTPDRYRANADVLDFSIWPHDRQALIDDLWALAVSRLHELPKYEAQVNKKSRITGRTLEPWRSLLSIALWLDENGVPGLWDRMESLSMDYQAERPELESSDITALVIKALCRYADNAVDAVNIESHTFSIKTAEVVSQVKTLIEETDADVDLNYVDSRRIGRVLSKMRLTQDRTSKCKGWKIHGSELMRWTTAYGIPWVTEKSLTLSVNGTNGTNGMTAQDDQIDLLPKCQTCIRIGWPCLLTPGQRVHCGGPFKEV
jgi:hypothetical protein